MQDFRKLKVWEKSHALALAAYRVTRQFPRDEALGLTAQVRRAAVSIAANIAEGCGRTGGRELGRFLSIALGSASELEYHVLLTYELGLLPEADYRKLTGDVTEVKRMLAALAQRTRVSRPKTRELRTEN